MNEPSFGLSRREMEHELRWIFRHPPKDMEALVKLMTSAMVTLIEKNNAAIAAQMAESTAASAEEDY